MGYSQWARIVLRNYTRSKTFEIKHFNIEYGKLHEAGDQSNSEKKPESYYTQKITPNQSVVISASGKQSAMSGCEGNFEVHTVGNEKQMAEKVCKISYDCPYYWWKDNKFEVLDKNKNFRFSDLKYYNKNGSLGEQMVDIEEP